MDLRWTGEAVRDVERLHKFIAEVNPRAAARVLGELIDAPERLADNPRLGNRLEGFEDREVRRILIGPYEMRYEVTGGAIYVLRVWHGREDR